jgi:hypothetical protein
MGPRTSFHQAPLIGEHQCRLEKSRAGMSHRRHLTAVGKDPRLGIQAHGFTRQSQRSHCTPDCDCAVSRPKAGGRIPGRARSMCHTRRRPTRSGAPRYLGCGNQSQLTKFVQEKAHPESRASRHIPPNQLPTSPLSAVDLADLGLILIKLSSAAAAISTTMPPTLIASCIASSSEMLSSAIWPASASRTPRQ